MPPEPAPRPQPGASAARLGLSDVLAPAPGRFAYVPPEGQFKANSSTLEIADQVYH